MSSLPRTSAEDVIDQPARAQFEVFLDEHRSALNRCLDGVTEEQARRSLVPSRTTLLGLVKHATFVEKVWFDQAFTCRSRAEIGIPATPDESFTLLTSVCGPGWPCPVLAWPRPPTFAEPEFAGMTFADLGRNPPCEIVPDGLQAVALLDITWRPRAVRVLLGTRKQQFSQTLAGLPQATDLWDASDETMNRIDVVWDARTATDGVGAASASKLLARKRPRLCPISDSLVIKAVMCLAGPGMCCAVWFSFRRPHLAKEQATHKAPVMQVTGTGGLGRAS